jgi:hypothetical protein
MSRKHFIDLAAGFRAQVDNINRDLVSNDGLRLVALHTIKNSINIVADCAAKHNPNFDYARFYAACGV